MKKPAKSTVFSSIFAGFILLTAITVRAQTGQTPPEQQVRRETAESEKPAADRNNLTAEERLSIIEEELEKARLQKATRTYQSVNGLGPAASNVYNVDQGFSIGGYGEIKYRDYRSRYRKDQTDVHRVILYAGYKFNDWIVFNSEIEYEHSGIAAKSVVTDVNFTARSTTKSDAQQGEVYVEFANVDMKFREWAQLAVGLNLIPMGITNYQHEPTTFYSVERPYTETNIIPSTWRSIGGLLHGELLNKAFDYRMGILGGERASKFSDSSWMRGGRQQGSQPITQDWAYIFSVDYKGIEGLRLGTSYYRGDSGQGEVSRVDWKARVTPSITSDGTGVLAAYNEALSNRNKTAPVRVNLAEAHYLFEKKGFVSRGLFTRGWMSENDTRAVNASTGKNIGMLTEGGYLEVGFNLFSLGQTNQKLIAFVRNEYFNTQKRTVQRHFGGPEDINDFVCANVLNGTCKTTSQLTNGNRDLGIISNSDTAREAYGVQGVADRVNDQRIITTGLAYFPIPNLVFKLEFESHNSRSNYHKDVEARRPTNGKIDQVNFAVGFIY